MTGWQANDHGRTRWPLGSILYALVLGFLLVTAIAPHDRTVWLMEVSWVIVGLVLIPVLQRRSTRPTALLSWALFLHAMLLIYGGWYTYAEVPLGDWAAEQFGWQRNHYDRLGHFAQGFFPALLYREVLVRKDVVSGVGWSEVIVFTVVMAFTALFELLEFAAALLFGDGAMDYLATQGDVWDAQWDMAWCGLGGLLSQSLLAGWHRRQLRALPDAATVG